MPLVLSISLGIAMLLNQKLRGMHIYRTIFFLPHITTWVAIALVWKLFYNQNFGIANYLLKYLFGMSPMAWLNEPTGVIQLLLEAIGFTFDTPMHPLIAGPSLALFGIILTNVWYDVGYFVIIFLAGLQTIDDSNYEAADIDGAKVVWARTMGPAKDRDLLEYFSDRRLWSLYADRDPPELIEYPGGVPVLDGDPTPP